MVRPSGGASEYPRSLKNILTYGLPIDNNNIYLKWVQEKFKKYSYSILKSQTMSKMRPMEQVAAKYADEYPSE